MKIRLSKSLTIHLFPGGTLDRERIFRGRRFTFWMNVTVTLMNLFLFVRAHTRGDEPGAAFWGAIAAAWAVLSLVMAVRILRGRSGFFRNPVSQP